MIKLEKHNFHKEPDPIIQRAQIKRTYLPTPILPAVVRNLDQKITKSFACRDDKIRFEAGESEDEALKKWNNIKKSLQVHGWKDKKTLEISTHLKSNPFLKTLSFKNDPEFSKLQRFGLEHFQFMTAQEMNHLLFHFVKNLTYLKNLSLTPYNFSILTDKDLKTMGSIIRQLPHLVSLRLSIGTCQSVTDSGLLSLVSPICRHLTKLQDLAISFPICKNLTDKAIKKMGSLVAHNLPSLQKFEVRFGWSQFITDDGFADLVMNVSKGLANLRELKLHFSHCGKITDMGLQVLGDCIIQHLTNLQSFSLTFNGQNITDKGLESVGLGLTKLSNLKRIGLDFFNCSEITDKGLTYFDWIYLVELKHFTLGFAGCKNISVQGAQEVLSKISNCPAEIELFNLQLDGTEITNNEVEDLMSQPAHFWENLTHLTLNFNYCEKVSDKSLKTVASKIVSYMPKLKNIRFYFYDTKMTGECMRPTKKMLNAIAKIEIEVEWKW